MYAYLREASTPGSTKAISHITLEYPGVRLRLGVTGLRRERNDLVPADHRPRDETCHCLEHLSVEGATAVRCKFDREAPLRGNCNCGWGRIPEMVRVGVPHQETVSIPYLLRIYHRAPERRCCEPSVNLASVQAELFFLIAPHFTSSPGSQPQRFRSSDVHQNVHEKAKHPRDRGEAI